MTQPAGVLAGQVPAEVARDIARADQVLKTLSPLDVGQVLLLKMVWFWELKPCKGQMRFCHLWRQRPNLRGPIGGVFVKRPKAGQDLRVDMPTIGPNTIDQVAQADCREL